MLRESEVEKEREKWTMVVPQRQTGNGIEGQTNRNNLLDLC